MILQQFPFSSITKKILEHYYNEIEEEILIGNYNFQVDTLFSDSKKGMLYDLTKTSSLLFNKIDISDIIDFEIDISNFKTNIGQLKMTEEKDNDYFSDYNTPLKIVSDDTSPTSSYSISKTAISKFIIFIKLIGMPELTLDNVYLIEKNEILVISMAENNPFFIGSLRIKTW